MNVSIKYFAFFVDNEIKVAELSSKEFSTDSYKLITSLPIKIINQVSANLVLENTTWVLPILIHVELSDHSLLKDMGFKNWKELVKTNPSALWTNINLGLGSLFKNENLCAVVGCKQTSQRFTKEVQEQSRWIGKAATECGYTLLTGGLSGVMELAAQGALLSGGKTIGILPGTSKSDANKSILFKLPSGIGIARNYQMALCCDIMIALNGGRGTMEEMCFALDFEKPVLSWNSWQLDEVVNVTSEIEIFNTLLDYREKLIINSYLENKN